MIQANKALPLRCGCGWSRLRRISQTGERYRARKHKQSL